MQVSRERCSGCGYCLLTCPVGAIESDGWASIDEESCTHCDLCVGVCPNEAILSDSAVAHPRRDYESRYDVAFIGSGSGSLTTAAALARQGRQVGIFEKLAFAGGRYTEIDYQGYAVTTAAWTSLGPKSNIREFLEEMGAPIAYVSLRDRGYDQQFTFRFKDGRSYPLLQAMLSRQDWRAYGRRLVQGRRLDLRAHSTRDYIEEHISNEDLIATVNAIALTASGVDIDHFPASEF